MKILQLISQRIDDLSEERDWSKYTLGKFAGVSPSTISTIRHAKGKGVNIVTLLNLCRGFGITLEEFFRDEMFDVENISDD